MPHLQRTQLHVQSVNDRDPDQLHDVFTIDSRCKGAKINMKPEFDAAQVFIAGVASLCLLQNDMLQFYHDMTMDERVEAFEYYYGCNPAVVAEIWRVLKIDVPGLGIRHLFWALYLHEHGVPLDFLESMQVLFQTDLCVESIVVIVMMFVCEIQDRRFTVTTNEHGSYAIGFRAYNDDSDDNSDKDSDKDSNDN